MGLPIVGWWILSYNDRRWKSDIFPTLFGTSLHCLHSFGVPWTARTAARGAEKYCLGVILQKNRSISISFSTVPSTMPFKIQIILSWRPFWLRYESSTPTSKELSSPIFQSLSVSESVRDQRQYHQVPSLDVLNWHSTQLHHLVKHSWANWI